MIPLADPRILVGLLVIAVVIGGFIASEGYGVKVTCTPPTIEGLEKTSLPPLSILYTQDCNVKGTVETLSGEKVCEFSGKVEDTRVLRCDGLSPYKDKRLVVDAQFYNARTGQKLARKTNRISPTGTN